MQRLFRGAYSAVLAGGILILSYSPLSVEYTKLRQENPVVRYETKILHEKTEKNIVTDKQGTKKQRTGHVRSRPLPSRHMVYNSWTNEKVEDIPEPYRSLFERAGNAHGIPPELLAAVFKKGEHNGMRWERLVSNYGAAWKSSSAGASGPFQFMPGTWKAYSIDGDGDGKKNIQDMEDAAHSAANYLAANMREASGSEERKIKAAIRRYNSPNWYVNSVYRYYQNLRDSREKQPEQQPISKQQDAVQQSVIPERQEAIQQPTIPEQQKATQ